MKWKAFFFIFISSLSCKSFSAFNEQELLQLDDINKSSYASVNLSIYKLENVIKIAIKDNPEKENSMLKLKRAWYEFINDKCDLESIESKGKDAEIVTVNTCIDNEIDKEINYFTHFPS